MGAYLREYSINVYLNVLHFWGPKIVTQNKYSDMSQNKQSSETLKYPLLLLYHIHLK